MQKVEKRTSSLPSPSRFLGLIVLWLFFGIIFILYTWHNYAWLQRGSSDLFKLWDFKLFYGGSLDFFQNGSPYRQTATLPFERVLDKNGNSPLGAVAFLVLAQLPLMLAAAVWVLLSLALLYWGLSYIWKIYSPSARWHWRAALLLFVYISFPVVDTIQLGSWGMIIAFLDFAAWYYARKGNEGRAGIFLGIAIALRWQPAIIFLYFLLVRRWRVVLFAVGTAVLSYVLGLLILGWSSIIDFLEIVFKLTGGGQIRGAYDGSLRAFIARLVDLLAFTGLKLDGLITPLWLVSGLALLALTLWRCRKLNYDQAFSLCIVFGLMLAPTSWMHYHMALLLPMTVLLAYRQWWPVIYTALLWLSMNIFVPLDFESNPLLYGMLLSLSLFGLYFALCRPKLVFKK